jgi:probable F420-dependent oxidoreductase
MVHSFRFTAQVPDFDGSVDHWQSELAWIADAGFTTVALADHFTGGYTMEPLVTLTAAALRSKLRVQTAVLGGDYRHPVLLHRAAATLDLLSEGRLELGLGAGWMTSDYEAAGLTMDPPGVRISRLEETLDVLEGLFSDEPLTYRGKYVTVEGLRGVPSAVQRPHPPFLIGGGGRRMLGLAGRRGDIVGVNANLSAGVAGRHSVLDVSWESMRQKVNWIREGAGSIGRDFDALELSMAQWLLCVTDSRSAADELLTKMASRLGVEAAWLDGAPGVLVGSPGRVIEKLQETRDRLGISYIQVHSGPRSVDLRSVAPVVSALAGT